MDVFSLEKKEAQVGFSKKSKALLGKLGENKYFSINIHN